MQPNNLQDSSQSGIPDHGSIMNMVDAMFSPAKVTYASNESPSDIATATNQNGNIITTLKSGQQAIQPTSELSSAFQGAYTANPGLPKGMLEATAMQESSMGTNKANYNPAIGKYAYVFGLTPVALKELKTKGIQANPNTLQGATNAAAAYLALQQPKYSDNADLYKKGYNGNTSLPFDPDKFDSMVDFYGQS